MIYLDYAANTPIEKDVLDVFYDTTLKYYANPNSTHKLGLEVNNQIITATEKIANMLNVLPEEIIYTSGATEANNLVIKGIADRYKSFGKHIILGSLEHNSIIAPATVLQEQSFDIDILSVTKDGLVDIDELKSLLRDDTILVSICAVDSELGLVQPIEKIADILKDKPNTFFFSYASQAIGKVNIDFSNVDLITIAPHKFYGLNGTGILIKKKDVGLKPIINGGKSTTIYRSGTPVVANIVSCAKSLEIAISNLENRYTYVSDLNKKIIEFLSKYDFIHINNTDKSVPHTINFSIRNIKSEDFAKALEEKEVYISTKTTCCPTGTPSKLVYALTKDKALASTSLRLSISHLTTKEEIEKFFDIFDEVVESFKKNGKI